MSFNQKLEQLLAFSLEDYPGSAYSLIQEREVPARTTLSIFPTATPKNPFTDYLEKSK